MRVCVNLIDFSNSSTFKCDCKQNFFGTFCENSIDTCASRTCSNSGYCVRNASESFCKCLTGFYGGECEFENTAVKTLKGFQVSSIIICVMFLTFTALTIILNDIWDYFIGRRRTISKRRDSNKEYCKKLKKIPFIQK